MENEEKTKTGRPTKYKPEYCQEIIDYFNIETTRKVKTEYKNKKGETWEKEELAAEQLRFLSGFARKIGVCHDTLCEWCKVHPAFSEAYKKAKALQKEHLITCGLLGLFPAAAFIFTAKNIAGMRDKQEVSHTFDWRTLSKDGTTEQENL